MKKRKEFHGNINGRKDVEWAKRGKNNNDLIH